MFLTKTNVAPEYQHDLSTRLRVSTSHLPLCSWKEKQLISRSALFWWSPLPAGYFPHKSTLRSWYLGGCYPCCSSVHSLLLPWLCKALASNSSLMHLYLETARQNVSLGIHKAPGPTACMGLMRYHLQESLVHLSGFNPQMLHMESKCVRQATPVRHYSPHIQTTWSLLILSQHQLAAPSSHRRLLQQLHPSIHQ